jgi:hypothetical protein
VEYVLRDSGARLVLHDAGPRRRGAGGLPAAALDGPGWDALLDPGAFEAIEPGAGRTGLLPLHLRLDRRPRASVLSHQSHLWVGAAALGRWRHRAGGRAGRGAALPHERPRPGAARLRGHATVVVLPRFEARAYLAAIAAHRCTWITGVPPMYAMLLRERDALAATDVSSVRNLRMGSAPSRRRCWRRSPPPSRARASSTATAPPRPGPVVFGPHPRGLPTPPLSVGYPHPAVELRLRATTAPSGGEQGRAGAALSRPDERLLEPPGTAAARHRRRLLRHR